MKIKHRERNSPRRYERRDAFVTEPGDVVDVEPELGEELLEAKPYFLEAGDADTDGVDAGTAAGNPGGNTDETGQQTDDGDVAVDLAESPEEEPDDFDADEWLEVDYTERERVVLDGEADEYLASIKDVETSETVEDAVDERRCVIEEGEE